MGARINNPSIISFASGSGVPTASDYAVGTVIYHADYEGLWINESHGGTQYWVSLAVQANALEERVQGSTGVLYHAIAVQPTATKILFRRFEVTAYIPTTNDGSNYWEFKVTYDGSDRGTPVDTSAKGPDTWIHLNDDINEVATIDRSDGALTQRFRWGETGSAGNADFTCCLTYSAVM